jgi:hypothetical protein
LTGSTGVPFGNNSTNALGLTNSGIQIFYNPTYAPGGDTTELYITISEALNNWVGSVPSGGITYGPGNVNIASINGAVAAIESVPGVDEVNITNPANIALGQAAGTPLENKLVPPLDGWAAPFVQLVASLS